MDKFVGEVGRRAAEAAEVIKDAAFDLSWDIRDSVHNVFGIPRFISSVASLGVAVVAAAGTASVAFDFTGKFFGKKECNECNGWEGLRCTLCSGSGRVQFVIHDPGLKEGEDATSQNIAASILEGRADVGYFPASVKLGPIMPFKGCPHCAGTGVIKCPSCKGNAWHPKISFDDVFNAPWKTWEMYRRSELSEEHVECAADPGMATYFLYGRDELEKGIKYDDLVKKKLLWKYKHARRYDDLREVVSRREPGWEELQQVLFSIDPDRAMRDPIFVPDVPYFKAVKKVEEEVLKLPVPPRPADWGDQLPFIESEDLQRLVWDSQWEYHWRSQKAAEIAKERVSLYKLENLQSTQPSVQQDVRSKADTDVAAPLAISTEQAKPVEQKKVEVKKRPDDDKKKRERQERGERMAKQAAEREAALARAKAARMNRK